MASGSSVLPDPISLPCSPSLLRPTTSINRNEPPRPKETGVWQWFAEGTGREEKTTHLCLWGSCNDSIKVQPRGGLTNMQRHLQTKHAIVVTLSKRKRDKQEIVTDASQKPMGSWLLPDVTRRETPVREATRKEKQQLSFMLLRIALETNMPFDAITKSETLRFFFRSFSSWEIPHRTTLTRLLSVYHTHMTCMVRDRLKTTAASLSITTDSTFLTSHQVPYICITGHWIDANWAKQSTVLSVFLAEQLQSAEFISGALTHQLNTQLNIGDRQLHCVTTDEGANFVGSAEVLKNAQKIRESTRCACHRIQLIVKNSIMSPNCAPLFQLLEKCSTIVNRFKNGWASARRDILHKYQKKHLDLLSREIEQAASNTLNRVSDVKRKALTLAQSLLDKDLLSEADETKQHEDEKAELQELSQVPVTHILPIADEELDSEQKEESASQLLADIETEEQETTRLVSATFSAQAYVDWLFRKRALIQRGATRWLTWINVVERCVIWREALEQTITEIRNGPLRGKRTDSDWASLIISKEELNVLEVFYYIGRGVRAVLEELESEKHVTISEVMYQRNKLLKIFTMGVNNETWPESIREFCHKAKQITEAKFSPKEDSVALLAATLDPRFKSLSFLSAGEIAMAANALETAYHALLVEQNGIDALLETSQPLRKRVRYGQSTDFAADILEEVSPEKKERKSEVKRYWELADCERNEDPLLWWKDNQRRFPTIAILAKRYLAIPASSAASERLFSRMKRVATPARAALSSDTLCKILFITENMAKDVATVPL